MTETERIRAGFLMFSAEEREVILRALEGPGPRAKDLAKHLALARYRTGKRRESDAQTDVRRRLLIGARVPRPLAERVKGIARDKGVSLYRLLVDTFEQMCDDWEVERNRLSGLSTKNEATVEETEETVTAD